MRRTKIVATMGPAVASQGKISELVAAGLDVARLNFSHGNHDTHTQMAGWLRRASEQHKRPIALLQDIQGPKVRVGVFGDGPIELVAGETVRLVPGSQPGAAGVVPIDYEFLLEDVGVGDDVLLSDGLIRLVVEKVHDDSLTAFVTVGGQLSDHKGAAFPDTSLRVPSVTPKDEADLEFGRSLEVDYVAASFVRTGADIDQVRELAGGVPVIAKIELARAYANLDDILSEASGAMVARGDLGVQLPLETIPRVQLDILNRTNAAGRISITATEMLESMINSPRPTRAEVTDVANAVMSGTDAVMLSGETAIGKYPVQTIEFMARICLEAERSATKPVNFLESHRTFASATAKAAVEAAVNLDLHVIAAFTESGSTARLLSKYRPSAEIIAFTPDPATYRRMAVYWGVSPQMLERRESTDLMLASAEKYLEKTGICETGEGVVMVAGTPPNQQASTNLMKLHRIGERGRGSASRR
ncbi:MAG: pyruvate kinase [Acidimicrobiia bacterium]|nr:pyruvate kinase [Acidimicrobiia bacterium]